MTNDPFRTPGEQAEPPSGLCETCVHMSKSHDSCAPEHFRCSRRVKPKAPKPELRFISSDLPRPKMSDPEWCAHIRAKCGASCPDYSEKQP